MPAQQKYFKGLFHAPPGRGKTRLLGTAQQDERTFPMAFLNFEGGDQTLAGLDIDVFDIPDFQAYDEVRRMLKDPKSKSDKFGVPFKSVGIDSITETQVGGMLAILERPGFRADPDQMGQPDWGLILTQMRRFVRQYKFLPMHVFMTALSKDEMVPRIGAVKVPAVQGAFAHELPGIVDVVGYLAEEGAGEDLEHILIIRNNPQFSVKARTPWGASDHIPDEIVEPTVTKLLDALGYKK